MSFIHRTEYLTEKQTLLAMRLLNEHESECLASCKCDCHEADFPACYLENDLSANGFDQRYIIMYSTDCYDALKIAIAGASWIDWRSKMPLLKRFGTRPNLLFRVDPKEVEEIVEEDDSAWKDIEEYIKTGKIPGKRPSDKS